MPGPLKTYDVVHNGHQTRLKLSDEDARRMGLIEGESTADFVDAEPEPEKKRRTPANKARTTPNK